MWAHQMVFQQPLLQKCIIFILKVQDSLNASIKKIGCEPKWNKLKNEKWIEKSLKNENKKEKCSEWQHRKNKCAIGGLRPRYLCSWYTYYEEAFISITSINLMHCPYISHTKYNRTAQFGSSEWIWIYFLNMSSIGLIHFNFPHFPKYTLH